MKDKTTIDNMRTLNIMCVYDKLLKHPEVKANNNFYSLLTLFEPGVKKRGVGFVEDICLQPDVSPQVKIVIMTFAGLFYEYTKKLDLEKDCGGCESISEETKELINNIKKVLVCDELKNNIEKVLVCDELKNNIKKVLVCDNQKDKNGNKFLRIFCQWLKKVIKLNACIKVFKR